MSPRDPNPPSTAKIHTPPNGAPGEPTGTRRLLAEFRAAKGLKAKLAAAAEALKFLPDLADPKVVATEIISGLNADIATHQRTQPSVALEAMSIEPTRTIP